MKPEEYGDRYSDHLLEQYKLYVEMTDRVSQRRERSNQFFITLLAGPAIVAILARFGLDGEGIANGLLTVALLISGLLGVALSITWFVNIRSYRRLNNARFKVISEMESKLPFASYAKEWDLLSPGYLLLSVIEQVLPVIILSFFLALVGYSVFLLFGQHL